MSEINAKDVMSLRNKTGLPMMDCKKALMEANGNVDEAEEIIRKKLKGKMDARTDRAAGEGRVVITVSPDGKAAAIVEIRAETDFTAKNEHFTAMADKVAKMVVGANAGEVAATAPMTAEIDRIRISTGENISYARGHKLAGGAGSKFGTYVHHDGKTAVVVQVEGDASDEVLKDICMHIMGASPRAEGVSIDTIPPAIVEKERKFYVEQAMESGKPREIAEKMVEGKMRKFYEDVALLEQPFVRDAEKKIKDLLPKGTKIKSFHRWQVGG